MKSAVPARVGDWSGVDLKEVISSPAGAKRKASSVKHEC